ncbi:MAG: 3-dehydroquinate synthase [Alphaproteobacteria bacterium]|nr:3-dehydroquinate synthase [Alphaproteobacteria bacterium]HPF46389.1 3-dehydroquinate synthase [Emcibacteraceae bacterium]HRW29372.1 3-dehydroquinate synthase [Emcibacteraceae bacterium]
MIQKTTVDLGSRSYDILIGENIIDTAADHIRPHLKRSKTVIITDENVAIHQLARLRAGLEKGGIEFDVIILPAGEATKSFDHLETLLNKLLSMRLERSDTIIAFGGGVIGDLVGFAASIYLRGINFIQIPTTLLAQVDSSVGGKTGINSKYGKNLIGAFHQPRLVLIDVTTLETLEKRHIIAGYAEIVKYGFINDPDFYNWLEKNGRSLIDGEETGMRALRREAIKKSCEAKAAIVSMDEKESGARALLNLGHTFGHALEAENGYNDDLYHGEAVAIGMILAFQLSERMGLCPPSDVERVKKHFDDISAQSISLFDFNVDNLLKHMQGDKKMSGGKLTFVLVSGIGKAFLSNEVNMETVKSLLKDALKG